MRSLCILLCVALTTSAGADDYLESAKTAILPPLIPFEGESRSLMLDADDEWATDFEKSGGLDSPDHAATMKWFERLADASPKLHFTSLGKSAEGRSIAVIFASAEGTTNAKEMARNGKPTVIAHAGIHSGEIDGKDAGMMLLRDLTVRGKLDLLDRVNLAFIPILNVDGHERRSEFSRINQRGPRIAGWRTNRRNLNLNRDYAKLDTIELRLLLRLIGELKPELYLDLHVTDGADYQYDITYGYNGAHAWSPSIAAWLDSSLKPHVDDALSSMGHVPGPLIFAVNGRNMDAGMWGWTAGPRFSNGYGDARHLPTILLENHSLKPYDQRVVGTYVFMRACLEAVANDTKAMYRAMHEDRTRRADPVALAWGVPQDTPPPMVDFHGISSHEEDSDITGTPVVRWTGKPEEMQIPLVASTEATLTTARPRAYFVPAAWAHLGKRLAAHGIQFETVEERREVECEMLRLPNAALDQSGENPYEGHARVAPGTPVAERRMLRLEPGSLIVPTDQTLGTLAVLLLEPESPDSFFQWGFLLECLQRTEYFEAYAIEPMAKAMLEESPALRAEFEERLASDAEFAESPRARLNFFYERTPFFDQEYRLYPIGRDI